MTYPSADRGYYPQPSKPSLGARKSRGGLAGGDTAGLARGLLAGVAALGAVVYLVSFGPVFNGHGAAGWFVRCGVAAAAIAAFVFARPQRAALVAVATLAVVGFLDALAAVVTGISADTPRSHSTGWALTVIVALTALQAIAAVAALVLAKDDAGASPADAYQAYLAYYTQASQDYYAGQHDTASQQRGGYGEATGYGDAAGYGAAGGYGAVGSYSDAAGYGATEATAAMHTRRPSQEADYGDFAVPAAPQRQPEPQRGAAPVQPVANFTPGTPAPGMPRAAGAPPPSYQRPPDDGPRAPGN